VNFACLMERFMTKKLEIDGILMKITKKWLVIIQTNQAPKNLLEISFIIIISFSWLSSSSFFINLEIVKFS